MPPPAESISVAASDPERRFVMHWGEMGSRWGVNRTVAELHAVLYLSDTPLAAEELADRLGVARSNVSTSLRELRGWGIIRVVRVPGDRRDHYESLTDVWEMFRIVLDERKKREIEPTMRVLRECLDELDAAKRPAGRSSGRSGGRDERVRQRIAAMLDFFDTMTAWYVQMRRLPKAALVGLAKTGGAVSKFLGGDRTST
jgi:DNA-binding transcriptional regulator GbsR (MarR family)